MDLNTTIPSQLTSPASSSTSSGSRKRPRTELSSEEKREARAERNRIAAQISRDRRKEEFSQLRQQISKLEKENMQLRAALDASHKNTTIISSTPSIANPPPISERESEKERENRELKERVRVLEKAWENVVSALQGIAGGLAPSAVNLLLPPAQTSSPVSPAQPLPLPTPSSSSASASVISGMSVGAPPSFIVTPEQSTRHLARVATTLSPLLDDEVSLQRVDCPQDSTMLRPSQLNLQPTLPALPPIPQSAPPTPSTPARQSPHPPTSPCSKMTKSGFAPSLELHRLPQRRRTLRRSSALPWKKVPPSRRRCYPPR